MAIMTVSVDDETERQFRELAGRILGKRKGHLGEATTEAMKLWIKEKSQETIARDALLLMEKEHHYGKKLWKSRQDLYDRGTGTD